MFDKEYTIQKNMITSDGEDEFQIRYIRNENVGVLTTRSEKSYFILDSQEYWYDLIQDQYPPKQKCSCKNDFFKVCFQYLTRKGTDDFRKVELVSQCTECGKIKNWASIDIDYSPSSQLFENAIPFCAQPKIKYKTHTVNGFWQTEQFYDLLEFLSQKQLFIYMWYWDETDNKRYFNQFSHTELMRFLSSENSRYLEIYFSTEPLNDLLDSSFSDEKGVYIDRNMWRKKNLIKIHAPIYVMGENSGNLYYMYFCSEYIDSDGKVQSKNEPFCLLTKEVLTYCKQNLK
ncbi:MAG: hypothetical protein IKM34_01580 [Clostridia bacterium]|nr:hypothetical protein [Clostridia bacterium]